MLWDKALPFRLLLQLAKSLGWGNRVARLPKLDILIWDSIPRFAGKSAFPFHVSISISSLNLYEKIGR